MSYAIDCSISQIRSFRESMRQNIEEQGEIFSADCDGIIFPTYNYGGRLGQVYSILMQNAAAVEELAYRSLDLINSDKFHAEEVLAYDKEVLDRIYRDIESAQRDAEDAKTRMRNAKSSLDSARLAAGRVSGDSEEEKKARAAAKKRVSEAQNAVSCASAALEMASRRLHRLEDIRDNVTRAIEQLSYFKEHHIVRRESDIRFYLSDCKNRKESINDFFKSLAKRFLSYREKMEELDKKAELAEELVEAINSHLAAASDAPSNPFLGVCVRDSGDLMEIAHSLTERMARLEALAAELRAHIASVRNLMQDNVIDGSSDDLLKAQKITAEAISDFENRAASFRRAANGISKYTKL